MLGHEPSEDEVNEYYDTMTAGDNNDVIVPPDAIEPE